MTVKDPARAAQTVMAMNLPRGVMWTGLLLAAALNAAMFTLSNMLLPTPPMLPPVMEAPLAYFAIVVLGLVAFIQLITWAGRLVGGQGSLNDVLAVMVWLQFLRVAVQAVALVLVLTIPVLSLVLVLAASLLGLYILLHFIAQAHRLTSLGKSAGVLILSVLAMAIAVSFLIALVGAPIMGYPSNV